jgi:RHS repeat-associated protein
MATRSRIVPVAGLLLGASLLCAASFGPLLADDSSARPTPLGAALTLLSDGSSLVTGGEGADGMLDAAVQIAPDGTVAALPHPMRRARAWHSATVLADGTVLLAGGVGAGGRFVRGLERFDPATETFTVVAPRGLAPRAAHSATLLTDGRVLLAGGLGTDGAPLTSLALWDPARGMPTAFAGTLTIARYGHTATLLGDGTVLVWGGYDASGASLANGELVDPVTQQVTFVPSLPAAADALPALDAAIPADGATDVPLDAHVTLRFSVSLAVTSVTDATVRLDDGAQHPARLVAAEGGRLVFVWPAAPLAPDTAYTVTLDGVIATDGQALPATALHFRTVDVRRGEAGRGAPAGPSTVGAATRVTTAEAASPTRSAAGAVRAAASTSPPLRAPNGVTAVAGQVQRLDGTPLSNITLQIGRQSTQTDAQGRFVVPTDGCGSHCVLLIDGRSVNTASATYGVFEDGVDVVAGQTTVLPYTIWMPALDTAHAVTIPSPTTNEMVVTNPALPGLELHLPPQTIIRDRDGTPVTQVTITPIPVDQPPFPLPKNVDVPLYFTVQPGGAYLESWTGTPAYLVYPASANALPRKQVPFWDYDPDVKGWYIYGIGRVSDDATRIVPDPGVGFWEFSGAMVNQDGVAPPTCAADEAVLGECVAPTDDASGGSSTGSNAPGSQVGGEPVDLATGLFTLRKTDLFIPDIMPIELTRVYRSGDDNVYRFGPGMTHLYAMFLWSAHQYTELDLIQPDGAKVHYVRVSAGEGFTDAVFEHTATPTRFYKSRVTWNGDGWDLTLRDGTTYVFGANAPLQAIRDRNGNQITLTRTNGQQGNITRVTSPSGRYIDITYNTKPETDITQVTDNLGRTVQYGYDGDGQLKTVTDPNGGVTTYTYQPHPNPGDPVTHRMVKIKDARGIDFIANTYNTVGKVTQQVQADTPTGAFAYKFAYTFDANGRVTETDMTNPRGIVRQVLVNADGYVTSDRRAVGLPEEQLTTFDRLPTGDLVSSMTDALGRTTAFTYDAMGNVLTSTRLAGTPNAVTTTRTYEPAFNQLASITDPLGHTTTFSYDAHGNRTGVTDALGHTTTTTFNSAGEPITVTDPLGNQTQLTYDGGDLVAVSDPLGHTMHRFLDTVGRLVATVDPLGRQTRYVYDALNRTTQVADARGGVTQYTYDPNGNLLTVIDARNNVTTYQPTNMDRLSKRTDPLGRFNQFTYDLSGNIKQYRDGLNENTDFTYDNLDRRTFTGFKETPDGSTTYESTLNATYDAGNRETMIADSAYGSIGHAYDGLDRLTSETTSPTCPAPSGGMCPVPATISYGYDAAGRRTSMSTETAPVTYTYDAANRLVQITRVHDNVQLSYDAANRRIATTLPNGVTIAYGYDAASHVTGITYTSAATTLGTLTYTYDAAGNRLSTGGTWARAGLPQALSAATYDTANQIATWAGTSVTYDADGRLRNDGTTAYTWNARGELTQMGSASVSASFQYDAAGRRAVKEVNGATSRLVYDGLNAISDYSATSIRAAILTGLRADETLARYSVSPGIEWLLPDVLGSTVALTTSSGTVGTQYTFDPFGATTTTGPADPNPSQFAGRENDSDGLYFNRARYYSPTFQRFLSDDPISLETLQLATQTTRVPRGVMASYQHVPALANAGLYLGDDPLAGGDATGECGLPCLVAIGAGFGAVNGAAGALSEPNWSWQTVLVSAGIGGAVGGLSVLAPETSYINTFGGGAIAGALVDVATEEANHVISGTDPFDLNPGAILGAAIGGGLAGPAAIYTDDALSNAVGSGVTSLAGSFGYGVPLSLLYNGTTPVVGRK